MTNKLPKSKNIVAFLESQGWKLDGSNQDFYLIIPPKDFKFRKEFRYQVPKNEKTLDYNIHVKLILQNLAEFYGKDKEKLAKLLSMPPSTFSRLVKKGENLMAEAS